jgi:endonuclease/exonuclease/phosphatase family metal-dependent hydrolase
MGRDREPAAPINPDVLLVQEVDRFALRSSMLDDVAILTHALQMPHSYFTKTRKLFPNGEYGDLILSKLPLTHKHASYILDETHEERPAVTRAAVEIDGRLVFLLNTHWPQDKGNDQQVAGVRSAEAVPRDHPCIFGGDFNRAYPDEYMKPLRDVPLAEAGTTTDKPVVHPGASPGIDLLLYTHSSVRPISYVAYPPMIYNHQFSDHPPVMCTFEIRRQRTLRMTVTPEPFARDQDVSVVVSAWDADAGTPVSGVVMLNGREIGVTGAALRINIPKRVRGREWDPELRKWFPTISGGGTLSVTAPGYLPVKTSYT